MSYQVELDIYSGPLDLLLYLIDKEEVDIFDIPIAKILEKYIEYLEKAKDLDVNLAAEFLVMASTLMEIKSRMLIPVEERPPEEAEEDPRNELVRQLLVYRAFKEAAMRLEELRELRARRYGRGRPVELPGEDPQKEPLKEVSLFALADAWANLMRQTLGSGPRTIVYDEVSNEELREIILLALQKRPEISFQAIIRDMRNRKEAAGAFLALLELVKLGKVKIYQSSFMGEILVTLRQEGTEEAPEPPGQSVEPYLPQPEAIPLDAEGQIAWRIQRRSRFQGIAQPEPEPAETSDLEEETNESEARMNRRIDEIIRRADEISARFEALRAELTKGHSTHSSEDDERPQQGEPPTASGEPGRPEASGEGPPPAAQPEG